ncbi:uncharacterized protein LOC123864357 [Maniola jurtina]|uniref:uncharacterized protein LOC123864357 n=1 Tax=Maniola jurtina TaxID=191418 RepID=UPI001E6861F0|nr:uncharacterized protein LOC123864357 [Maniola jurtina]
MFGFTILLVAGVVHANIDNAKDVYAPPYVQSREAFTYVKTYLSQSLTPNTKDIYDPASRQPFSFGILADVVGALVTANRSAPSYHPLLVLDKRVPYAWRNYMEIATNAQSLLNEASVKIRLVEDLIDNMCDADSVTQCNAKVQNKVDGNPYAYKGPAEILLLLGKVSVSLRSLEPELNSVTADRNEIPYLINNVQSEETAALINDLENAYDKITQLQFRMYSPMFRGL